MEIDVSVKSKILKPISEVFYAIIDKNEISKYFTTSSSSDLIEGRKVTWEWSDFCAVQRIEVSKALLQTQGWTDFVNSLKAYLYTGINLRNGKMN